MSTFDASERYAVAGYDGIAFAWCGPETAPTEDTYWDGIESATGRVLMRMVGDDRLHSIDPDDVTLLADDDYCASCGQVGCSW